MIRQHENPIAFRAGLFSVLVHGILLGILLVSFNWNATKPMSVAEVELWDAIPQQAQPKALPKPIPDKPAPVKKVEPIKPVEKPQPVETPKADIQLKKEKPLPPKVEKPKEPPPKDVKPTPEPKKPDAEQAKKELEKQTEALKKLQEEMLSEDNKATQTNAAKVVDAKNASINQGEVNKYMALIASQVRQKVNKEMCSTGKPEILVAISLIPTGEVVGTPKILQGSGNAACDEAVERAILAASPLQVPKQTELFSQFRELKLKFRPNDGN